MGEQLNIFTDPRRFYGTSPTETEQKSGEAIFADNMGPMKPNKAGHRTLWAFRSGQRMTAYDASKLVSGDWHGVRREVQRLLVRGYTFKDGTLPNHAPRGRKHVDAYRITRRGFDYLYQHGKPLDETVSGS